MRKALILQYCIYIMRLIFTCCCPFVCRLSSVTLVCPTQPVEIFGIVSIPLGSLAIHWHPRKILRRSSQGNPYVRREGVKRKRGSQLFNYQVFNLVHKTVFSPYLLPSIFHDYFTRTSSIHRYETRHKKLYLTHVNTRFGQRILRYKGTQLWNRLPNNLSNNTASQSFRNKLQLLLICDPM